MWPLRRPTTKTARKDDVLLCVSERLREERKQEVFKFIEEHAVWRDMQALKLAMKQLHCLHSRIDIKSVSDCGGTYHFKVCSLCGKTLAQTGSNRTFLGWMVEKADADIECVNVTRVKLLKELDALNAEAEARVSPPDTEED